MTRPIDAKGFRDKFAVSDDPWDCRGSESERLKRRRALGGLELVSNAMDVACGDGAGTRDLAARVMRTDATDGCGLALSSAARLLSDIPRMRFHKVRLPNGLPRGLWRRIFVSELVYYLGPHEIDALAVALARRVAPGGSLISVHHVVPFSDARTPPIRAEALFHQHLKRRLRQASAARYGRYVIRRYFRVRA